MGIDREGRKEVLGVVEGTTENEAVGHRLLSGLIERGLEVERARLFVIDGGKSLRRAIRSCFGAWALAQRCQLHKTRNVLDHLPEGQREWVLARLRRACRRVKGFEALPRLLVALEQHRSSETLDNNAQVA